MLPRTIIIALLAATTSGHVTRRAVSTNTLLTTTSSTAISQASTSTSTVPQPIQTGVISTCQTFYQVEAGDTCQKIIDRYGTFSLSQFLSWNPYVDSSCSNLQIGAHVCVGVPSPSTTSSGPASTPISTNGFPSPVQAGITSNCTRFYEVAAGDSCQKIVNQYGSFTLAQFYAWNPAVGSNCATLQLGYFVCVGVASTSTTTSNAIPSPTQSGIIKTCTKYNQAGVGGSCTAFSNRLGISLAQLYAWNSVLGYHGENCTRNFTPGDYYCIAVSGPLPAPGPTQAGIVDTCTGYMMANPGGSCPVFANRVGISLQQLYAWNPVLGSNGENCQTKFWANTYYCTSVAG